MPSDRAPREARQALAEELVRWRHDPRKHGKISKKLAKQIAEGPPGPERAAWNAFEAGAAILIAALARKAVERFLSGEPPPVEPPLDAAGTAGGATADPKHAKDDVTKSAEAAAGDTAAVLRDVLADRLIIGPLVDSAPDRWRDAAQGRASGGTADAPALGAGVARRASSNLASPTIASPAFA